MKRAVVVCIFVAIALIAGALSIADIAVRRWVESEAERQISAQVPIAHGVDVEIDGFPFTVDLLARGRVDGIHMRVDSVDSGGFEATDLRFDVEGLRLDMGALVGGAPTVEGIDGASMEALVSIEQVIEVTGAELEIEDGRLWRRMGSGRVELRPRVVGTWLHLEEGRDPRPLLFPLPSSAVKACTPRAMPVSGGIKLRCAVNMLHEPLVFG